MDNSRCASCHAQAAETKNGADEPKNGLEPLHHVLQACLTITFSGPHGVLAAASAHLSRLRPPHLPETESKLPARRQGNKATLGDGFELRSKPGSAQKPAHVGMAPDRGSLEEDILIFQVPFHKCYCGWTKSCTT